MISALDDEVSGWAEALLTGTTVTLEAPTDDGAGEGLSIYLFDLRPAPAKRSGAAPTLAFRARYLVTAWADSPGASHAILSRALEGAMAQERFEVELDSGPRPPWAAFGCRPRPYFHMSALASRRASTSAVVRRVEHPLRVVLEPLDGSEE